MSEPALPPSMSFGPNMQGVLDGVHAMMTHLRSQDDGLKVPSLEELYTISGFGLGHYAYEPQYNVAYDPPRLLSRWSQWFSNFGPLESVGYYTGYELSELNFISEEDFWRAMVFELDQGRLVLSMGLHGEMEPVLVVGYEQSRMTRVLHVRTPGGQQPVSINMWGVEHAQGDNGVFDNWLVLVRPSATEAWDKPANQRFTLIKWVVDHHANLREFFHETRENYVVGSHAYERMERLFLEEVASLDPQKPEQIVELASHIQSYRLNMAAGRRAAATVLGQWAQQTQQISKFNAQQAQRAQEMWAGAALEYGHAATCFEQWIDRTSDADVLSAEGGQVALQALAQARQAEARAATLCERSVEGVNLFGG